MRSKYTFAKRMAIGRAIYEHQLSLQIAANKYGVSQYTARSWLRKYKSLMNTDPLDASKQNHFDGKSKYSIEERLSIGKDIYDRKMTTHLAAAKYGVNRYTTRDWLRLYKASINVATPVKKKPTLSEIGMEEMTRNEIADEVMRIQARLLELESPSEDN